LLEEKVLSWERRAIRKADSIDEYKDFISHCDEFWRNEDLFTEISLPPELESQTVIATVKTETRSVKR